MKMGKSFKNLLRLEFIDFSNTFFWFMMDALWLFEVHTGALILMVFSLISSILTVLMSKKRIEFYMNGTNFCWLLVNSGWLLEEVGVWSSGMLFAKGSFFAGAFLLILVINNSSPAKSQSFFSRIYQFFKMKNKISEEKN